MTKKTKRPIEIRTEIIEEAKPVVVRQRVEEEEEVAKETRLQVAVVNCKSVNVRESPEPNSKVRFIAVEGNKFYLIKVVDGWSMIESDIVDKFGFIRNEYVEQVV